MRAWMLVGLLSVVLSGCATAPPAAVNNAKVTEAKATESASTNRFKDAYYFEHRLLPEWTFNSDGMFFNDLMQGAEDFLRDTALQVVDERYANALQVTALPEYDAVLIELEPPTRSPLCRYILIRRTVYENAQAQYKFFTYEHTIDDVKGSKVTGVVGYWNADKSRGNMGPRHYSSPTEFMTEALTL